MKRTRILILLLCVTAAALVYDRMSQSVTAGILGHVKNQDGHSLVVLSDPYRIDRIFESMQGPHASYENLALFEQPTPELIWITGAQTEVLDKRAQPGISQEFFCHSNLLLDSTFNTPESHNQHFGTSLEPRLFTLVPGRMNMKLPDGFGIPVSSNEKFVFVSMSLNLNEPNANFDLRLKSHINFVRENEAPGRMKPLFLRSLFVAVPVANGTNHGANLPDAICAVPGSTNLQSKLQALACAPPSMTASAGGVRGTNTVHWMVPPGRHTYFTDVTDQLKLEFNTTMHYVTGHLHPMGESLILRDKTSGETIVSVRSKDYEARRGVAHMEEFNFPEGLKIYKDHEYELETTYNNRMDKPADVMAIIYAFLLEKNFDRTANLSQPPSSIASKIPTENRM
jgi:hypothetical protein